MRKTALALLAACLPLPAAALDSSNAVPVIEFYADATIDPASLPWLTDSNRGYVTSLQEQLTRGDIIGYVIAAAPDGSFGARAQYADFVEVDQADLVRQALQECEFTYHLSCRIIAIDGHPTARPGNLGWSEQPQMLSAAPAEFDHARVPLVSEQYRAQLREYQMTLGPKALAIGINGSWAWRGEKTIETSIAEAMNACRQSTEGQICYLYAVGNTVVLSPDQ